MFRLLEAFNYVVICTKKLEFAVGARKKNLSIHAPRARLAVVTAPSVHMIDLQDTDIRRSATDARATKLFDDGEPYFPLRSVN